jgi:ABC-type antimicrobial peptide transport system ATPase subunit
MDIKEIIEKKETLRSDILNLIRKFQEETGLWYVNIDGHQHVVNIRTINEKQILPEYYDLEIKINIE